MRTLIILACIVAGLLFAFFFIARIGRNLNDEADGGHATPQSQAPSSEDHRGGPPPSTSKDYLNADEAAYYLVRDEGGKLPVRIKGGFFVHRPTGKKVPPGNRQMTKHGALSFNVRGVAYYKAAGKAANTMPGTPTILRREPDNKHDSNAIAVVGVDRRGKERVVGYVNKGNAKRLAKRLDGGETLTAWFMRGSGYGVEPWKGIAVVVTDEDMKRELF